MPPDDLVFWAAERGLTIYRLARLLGRPDQTVRDWTNGRNRIPPDLWRALRDLDEHDLQETDR